MLRRPGLLLLVGTFLALATSGGAEAERPPTRSKKVCNRSKESRYLATASYSGEGSHTLRGWQRIKPGACAESAAELYAFFPTRHEVKGVAPKSKRRLCVPGTPGPKPFTLQGRLGDLGDTKKCAERRGVLVPFFSISATTAEMR